MGFTKLPSPSFRLVDIRLKGVERCRPPMDCRITYRQRLRLRSDANERQNVDVVLKSGHETRSSDFACTLNI